MKERRELIHSKSYWLTNVQIDVFNLLNTYMNDNGLTQKQVADQLKVSPSYISQILNGNFNFTIAKLIELSLAVGKVPLLNFETFDEFLHKENFPDHTYRYTFHKNSDGGSFADIPVVDMQSNFIVEGGTANATLVLKPGLFTLVNA